MIDRIDWSPSTVYSFFYRSDYLDYVVLRPLSHVAPNWELVIGGDYLFEEEDGSLAAHLNVLVEEISLIVPSIDYHSYENNILYNYSNFLNKYQLKGKIWHDKSTGLPLDKSEIGYMIEQGSSGQVDVPDLVMAAAGRIATSMYYGVDHFDKLDSGHMAMLGIIITIILFRRFDFPAR